MWTWRTRRQSLLEMLHKQHAPNQAETFDDVRENAQALFEEVVTVRTQASRTIPVERPGVTSPQGQQQQQ